MIDIDANWNQAECSLDEHRMKELAKIKQPGFGSSDKVKSQLKASGVNTEQQKEPDSGE